jgi:hypothetical protein
MNKQVDSNGERAITPINDKGAPRLDHRQLQVHTRVGVTIRRQ